MYSRTAKVLGGIQYTMNSSKTQVNKQLKSLNKRLNNINKRLVSNAPVAISTRNSNTGKDYYKTKGKERISNVTALNAGFNIVDVFINPANSSLFPWLSGIGKKYDLYHFKRLRFTYVPSLPTSEEGSLYIGLDYNTLDPAPNSSSELCQLSHWTMNVVWKPTSIAIDLNSIGWLYTRTGPVANADYKTYDLGKLFVATEGVTYTGTVGYIEVEYDVEFKRRQPDYTSSVIPTTDIYTPMAQFYNSGQIAPSNTTSFTSSFTNNSIFIIDNTTGSFTVTKDVYVFIISKLASSFNEYDSLAANGSTISGSRSCDVVPLSVGTTYKLHISGSNNQNYSIATALFVVDNV
jgi:hypothetical protein